jgi:hypothetical protein
MENPLPEDTVPEEEEFSESEPDQPKKRPEYSVLNGVQTVVSIALVMATLLTLWNPRKVFSTSNLTTLLAEEATQEAKEAEENRGKMRIAIVAGHWQDSNPGEVCTDGLIESDVNYDIASRTAQKLEKLGYAVDLFPEYDLDYLNYEGSVLLAIYSGSCTDDPAPASGFKVGGAYSATNPDQVDLLATCVSQEYQQATGLPFTYEVINSEHKAYHIFRDIGVNTPAVLLELGSLNTDRKILVNQADNTAQGIVSGILCFTSSFEGSGQ